MNKKVQNKKEAKQFAFAWTDDAWEDYLYWQEENPKIVDEINRLLEECRRDAFRGTGKPEPLKGDLTGYWSRRITKEHRLVYLPADSGAYVAAIIIDA